MGNNRIAFGNVLTPEDADRLGVFDVTKKFERKPDESLKALAPADAPQKRTVAASRDEGFESSDKHAFRHELVVKLRNTANGGFVLSVSFNGVQEEYVLSKPEHQRILNVLRSVTDEQSAMDSKGVSDASS